MTTQAPPRTCGDPTAGTHPRDGRTPPAEPGHFFARPDMAGLHGQVQRTGGQAHYAACANAAACDCQRTTLHAPTQPHAIANALRCMCQRSRMRSPTHAAALTVQPRPDGRGHSCFRLPPMARAAHGKPLPSPVHASETGRKSTLMVQGFAWKEKAMYICARRVSVCRRGAGVPQRAAMCCGLSV